MKKISILLVLVFITFSCNKSNDTKKEDNKKQAKVEVKKQESKTFLNLGKKIMLKKLTKIKDIKESPKKFLDKNILVEGTITKVCTRRGCWMNVSDGKNEVIIKVKDGVMVFPVEAIGKFARVEGVLYSIDVPKHNDKAEGKHQHKHEHAHKHEGKDDDCDGADKGCTDEDKGCADEDKKEEAKVKKKETKVAKVEKKEEAKVDKKEEAKVEKKEEAKVEKKEETKTIYLIRPSGAEIKE